MGGISLKCKLFSSNPCAKEGCSRTDCLPCKSGEGEGGICHCENVDYGMVCKTCLQQGVSKVYLGESSRTLFQRSKEHWSAYLGKTEASDLHKHETEHHQQMPAERKIKVNNYHTKPLRQQIEESVLINNARGGQLLNSKSEMTRAEKNTSSSYHGWGQRSS